MIKIDIFTHNKLFLHHFMTQESGKKQNFLISDNLKEIIIDLLLCIRVQKHSVTFLTFKNERYFDFV